MLGLLSAMENTGPTPGLLERYCKEMQDDAVSAEILGLASMEENHKKCQKKISRMKIVDPYRSFHTSSV
jgi:hypothetical protein